MASTESTGPRLGVNTEPSGDATRDAKPARKGGRNTETSRGDGWATLEQIVSVATRAGSAATLAAMKEIRPSESRSEHSGQTNDKTHEGGSRSPGRALEELRPGPVGGETEGDWTLYVGSARDTGLARLIETERGRLVLIDSLLGALGALFEDRHEMRGDAYGLSSPDPGLIVALMRKMLGGIINRLDRVYVDPLIAAAAARRPRRAASQRRPVRSSRRNSTPRQRKRARTSGRSASADGVARSGTVRRGASRAIRGRQEVRSPGRASPRARR
jgi:hypothetical protein